MSNKYFSRCSAWIVSIFFSRFELFYDDLEEKQRQKCLWSQHCIILINQTPLLVLSHCPPVNKKSCVVPVSDKRKAQTTKVWLGPALCHSHLPKTESWKSYTQQTTFSCRSPMRIQANTETHFLLRGFSANPFLVWVLSVDSRECVLVEKLGFLVPDQIGFLASCWLHFLQEAISRADLHNGKVCCRVLQSLREYRPPPRFRYSVFWPWLDDS